MEKEQTSNNYLADEQTHKGLIEMQKKETKRHNQTAEDKALEYLKECKRKSGGKFLRFTQVLHALKLKEREVMDKIKDKNG